jgi:S1-C subfamily serine protease
MNESIPISTQWLLEASKESSQKAINSVYLIYCQKTESKGTGFAIKSGRIITNWHVIKDCVAKEIVAISSDNQQLKFTDLIIDENRDLAILIPESLINSDLEIDNRKVETETKVSTWGHPLEYNGPSPILSVGYLAGFKNYQKDKTSSKVRRYIVNGALNPGNSGGPLFIFGTNKIIGIVVAKHAPITQFLLTAIKALAENKSGLQYSATNEKGENISFAESQIVASLLEHQRKLTQVMLGEAVAADELITFLKENNIKL